MLGGFHMTKCVLHCVDKFIKGNGLEDMLRKIGVFGSKVLKMLLAGTHYVRSFRGILILSSAISSLKWSAFYETVNDGLFN